MRRHRAVPLALAAAALWLSAGDAEARYYGNLNLFVGQKWLTHSQWEPVAEQPELGLMLAFAEERVSVHFALDAYYAKEEVANRNPAVDMRVKGTSGELAIGVRKVWDLCHPAAPGRQGQYRHGAPGFHSTVLRSVSHDGRGGGSSRRECLAGRTQTSASTCATARPTRIWAVLREQQRRGGRISLRRADRLRLVEVLRMRPTGG
jgi:hypothetical protein